MIIDMHTHIFPDDMIENREKFFPGEPEFKLLYGSPKSSMIGAENLIKTMDEEGVDLSVVFGFPFRDMTLARKNNDTVIEAVKKYPNRLMGMACFDIFSPETEKETLRCINEGLSGVGELAVYGSGIDENALDHLSPVMEICRGQNFPVMIHTNEPVGHKYPGKTPITLEQIERLAQRFPENRIILAHWGGGILFYELLRKQMGDTLKNIYYDTAASPFLYRPEIYRLAAEMAGGDKILFGSDYPLIKPGRYFRDIAKSGAGEELVRKIKGENGARLLGISHGS